MPRTVSTDDFLSPAASTWVTSGSARNASWTAAGDVRGDQDVDVADRLAHAPQAAGEA